MVLVSLTLFMNVCHPLHFRGFFVLFKKKFSNVTFPPAFSFLLHIFICGLNIEYFLCNVVIKCNKL